MEIKVATVWKDVDNIEINVGGTWKTPDLVSINVGGVWKTVWQGILVTLTDASNSAFKFGSNATAYFYWNSDGTVDSKDNTSPNQQVHAGTDWVIPNSAAPGAYRGKRSALTGDTAFFVASMGTSYAALTSNKYCYVYDSTVFSGGKSCTFTVHIDDGTTEQDTASYTLSADREDF